MKRVLFAGLVLAFTPLQVQAMTTAQATKKINEIRLEAIDVTEVAMITPRDTMHTYVRDLQKLEKEVNAVSKKIDRQFDGKKPLGELKGKEVTWACTSMFATNVRTQISMIRDALAGYANHGYAEVYGVSAKKDLAKLKELNGPRAVWCK